MIFEDAVGSRDTLLIGYDTSATDSIDVFFDEKNIIATEMDSIFGVRISNEWENRTFYDRVGTYHTKKNIVPSECRYYTVPIVIDSTSDITLKSSR